MSNPLRFDVFVSVEIPVVTSDLPPGLAERRWVAYLVNARFR
jgi:hypothetical protein